MFKSWHCIWVLLLYCGCSLQPSGRPFERPNQGVSIGEDDVLTDPDPLIPVAAVQYNLGVDGSYDVERILQRLALDITGQSLSLDQLERLPSSRVRLEEVQPWIDAVYAQLTWDGENKRPTEKFSDWLIEYHQNIMQVFMPRKANGFDSPIFLNLQDPKINALNLRYVQRFPQRYFDPDNGDVPEGRVDVAPSSPNHASDLGYYLQSLEPALYAAALVGHDRPYGEIVTGRQSVSNEVYEEVMASRGLQRQEPVLYGQLPDLLHWTGGWHFRKAWLNPAPEGSGVLTHSAMLQTYSNPRQWVNRAVYGMWLCQDITPAAPDSGLTYWYYRKEASPPLDQKECAGCHYPLDGLANLRFEYVLTKPLGNDFKTYTAARRFIPFDDEPLHLQQFNSLNQTTWPSLHLEHYLLGSDGKSYLALQGFHGLGKRIAAHPWFKQCVAKRLFRHLFRRAVSTQRDRWIIEHGVAAYEREGDSFKGLLKALVSLPDYFILTHDPEWLKQEEE